MAERRLPDIATLRQLLDSGKTYAEAGELYGVSGQAVWSFMDRHNATKEQAWMSDLIPWRLTRRHRGLGLGNRFRTLLSVARGGEVSDVEWRRLKDWFEKLNASNAVVAYHPDAPANEASKAGGWYYVPRGPGDEWIIRLPKGAELPRLAKKLAPYGFDPPRHLDA